MAVLTTNKTVIKWAETKAGDPAKYPVEQSLVWTNKIDLSGTDAPTDLTIAGGTLAWGAPANDATTTPTISNVVFATLRKSFPDGLPLSKSANYYKVSIESKDGVPLIKCRLYKGTAANALGDLVAGEEE